MDNIGTQKHIPPDPTLVGKVPKESSSSPKNSDHVTKTVPNLLTNSEYTTKTNPQNPQLKRPINVNDPNPEEVHKLVKLAGKYFPENGDKSGKTTEKETDHIENAEIKQIIPKELTPVDQLNYRNDIREGKKLTVFFDEDDEIKEWLTSKNIDNYSNEHLEDKHRNNSSYAIIDNENVHWVGKPPTENQRRALENLKTNKELSPKLRAILAAPGKVHYYVQKDNFLNSMIEAFKIEAMEKGQDTQKQEATTNVATKYPTSSKPQTKEVKNKVTSSAGEIATHMTLKAARNSAKDQRKADEETKEDLNRQDNEEIHNDQIKQTMLNEEILHKETGQTNKEKKEFKRDNVKDSLTRHVEKTPTVPGIAKPSQTV